MTREDALKHVAYILVKDTERLHRDNEQYPILYQITQDCINNNLETARVLGIEEQYRAVAKLLEVKVEL